MYANTMFYFYNYPLLHVSFMYHITDSYGW